VSEQTWQIAALPDGRIVEYVDAVPIERTTDGWVIDVTVMIDHAAVETLRVTVAGRR
jgi:hypothetical protein